MAHGASLPGKVSLSPGYVSLRWPYPEMRHSSVMRPTVLAALDASHFGGLSCSDEFENG